MKSGYFKIIKRYVALFELYYFYSSFDSYMAFENSLIRELIIILKMNR